MTLRIEKKKWILYRHISDFHLLTTVAKLLKSYSKTGISSEEKNQLNLKLKETGLYKERNSGMPLDAINHKINQLSYYMFGYQAKVDGKDRFLFSPLGNLLIKNIGNPDKVSKIFLSMLWALQYPHPHSGTHADFNVYPFRLIFKLLSDDRLSGELYAFEVSYLLVFIEEIDEEGYETLVSKLLELRKLSDSELMLLFENEPHAYVNAAYEWDYYVSTLLAGAGVLCREEGTVVGKLQHGNTQTFRKITRNKVTIPPELLEYLGRLLENYSFAEKPLLLNDSERLSIDIVKEIYSFYPECISEYVTDTADEVKIDLLHLPKLIEQYANNNDGEEAYLFEEVLTRGFNLFYNVEAVAVGGAGNTDLECLYLTKKKKFSVDAKSTKNKLSVINSGRLANHREKIGGEYTIVVTPRYVPAVLHDIKGSSIVIILASTLAEYLYNSLDNNIREIDYEDFDSIITENLGTDVSSLISDITLEKFALNND